MMRVGLYKPVHVKTLASQQRRMLLTSRKLLRDKLQDMENELRGTLRNFGLKVGVVSPGQFEARIKELVAGQPPLEMIVAPLLAVRRVVREQLAKLDKMSSASAEKHPSRGRWMRRVRRETRFRFGRTSFRLFRLSF